MIYYFSTLVSCFFVTSFHENQDYPETQYLMLTNDEN